LDGVGVVCAQVATGYLAVCSAASDSSDAAMTASYSDAAAQPSVTEC
jgi:hypothetical protein